MAGAGSGGEDAFCASSPRRRRLARGAGETGLRSVLNLRGAHPGKAWYAAEVADSEALGLVNVDFRMSADRRLAPDEIARLSELLSKMPQPLLIHYRAGADRTGLASALFLLAVKKAGPGAAGRQISLAYGHVAIPVFSDARAMDQSWDAVKAMFPATGGGGRSCRAPPRRLPRSTTPKAAGGNGARLDLPQGWPGLVLLV